MYIFGSGSGLLFADEAAEDEEEGEEEEEDAADEEEEGAEEDEDEAEAGLAVALLLS